MPKREEAIGIDVGGTNIKGARVSHRGEILDHAAQPTAKSSAAVLAQIDALIERLDGTPRVGAIGIGVPSRVDFKSATIFPGGYVDLSGSPLAGRLKSLASRSVVTDNDGTMALVAEARLGAARDHTDIVMLTIGTGIGGAVMLDRKILHGKATAGQLGHVTVALDGPKCVCGRNGCLETFSSGTALAQHMAEARLPEVTRVEDLIVRSDLTARTVIDNWIRPLRVGIDSLVASFDPQIVVLGGGLGGAASMALNSYPPGSEWFTSLVRPAALGSEAGVIGAALAALEHLA